MGKLMRIIDGVGERRRQHEHNIIGLGKALSSMAFDLCLTRLGDLLSSESPDISFFFNRLVGTWWKSYRASLRELFILLYRFNLNL